MAVSVVVGAKLSVVSVVLGACISVVVERNVVVGIDDGVEWVVALSGAEIVGYGLGGNVLGGWVQKLEVLGLAVAMGEGAGVTFDSVFRR